MILSNNNGRNHFLLRTHSLVYYLGIESNFFFCIRHNKFLDCLKYGCDQLETDIHSYSLTSKVKVSPSLTDAAMARITQGTKVFTEGGHDKVFKQTFETLPGEKLLKAYVCYVSTSSGPVIGTLYISTKKVAFCSDYPFCYYSSTGQQQWMYYKVLSSALFLSDAENIAFC